MVCVSGGEQHQVQEDSVHTQTKMIGQNYINKSTETTKYVKSNIYSNKLSLSRHNTRRINGICWTLWANLFSFWSLCLTSLVGLFSLFLNRSLLPSRVTELPIESEITCRRLDYSMSGVGFVSAGGAVTTPDDQVPRCLSTYASHPKTFSQWWQMRMNTWLAFCSSVFTEPSFRLWPSLSVSTASTHGQLNPFLRH